MNPTEILGFADTVNIHVTPYHIDLVIDDGSTLAFQDGLGFVDGTTRLHFTEFLFFNDTLTPTNPSPVNLVLTDNLLFTDLVSMLQPLSGFGFSDALSITDALRVVNTLRL